MAKVKKKKRKKKTKKAEVKKEEIKKEIKVKKKEPKKEKKKIQKKKKTKHGNLFTAILPLGKEDKIKLHLVQEVLEPTEIKELKYLLKTHKARFAESDFDTTHGFLQNSKYLSLACNIIDEEVRKRIEELNQKVVKHEKEKLFEDFAHNVEERILSLIAPHIVGLGAVKKAGLIQLFAKEKVHVLALGDPATGKTDVLRSIAELAPISSFGLGSGASKAGLTLTVSGKEIVKGLLPLADKGIACIDELNLLRSVDRAGLLNAMEKGFVTYDKANTHVQLDARVKIFATANPVGDRFVGKSIDILKKQVPFDLALLSRFHLVFLIRRPSTKEFLKITDKIIREDRSGIGENDKQFAREYIEYALKKNVEFDKNLGPLIQGFAKDVKKDENQFLVEISPRIVIGIMNMARAVVRMKLKEKVEREDIIKVLKIFNSALYIKKDER